MTRTAPAFQIVRTDPTYCPITDGQTGSRRVIVRYCETEAFAHKIACVLTQIDYDLCGESDYRAMPVGDVWADLYRSAPRIAAAPLFFDANDGQFADDFPF
jgi:hypothetical protein